MITRGVYLVENIEYMASVGADRWPSICHRIEVIGAKTEEDKGRVKNFYADLSRFFDTLQENYRTLQTEERDKCGQNGIAADVTFKIDIGENAIFLDRIFKYCSIENHLFKELIEILHLYFPEFMLIVPALKGYQLAEEIHRYLGDGKIEWIYLKSSENERLLIGEDIGDITLDGIIEDTKRHYAEIGGIVNAQMHRWRGSEISMYYRSKEGVEEVVWMLLKVPISNIMEMQDNSTA